MNEQGYETLKRFSEKVKKLSPSERKKIEKMVGEHKTFIGAAWVYFSQSTPAKTPTTKTPTTKAPTTKAPTPVKKLTPYVKELGPGIRTIHFKNL